MRIEIQESDGQGVHDVFLEGELICRRTRTPLCSAARVLIARGYSPDILMEKARVGSDRVDMTATIGAAAKLTVWEGDKPPRFATFRERDPDNL